MLRGEEINHLLTVLQRETDRLTGLPVALTQQASQHHPVFEGPALLMAGPHSLFSESFPIWASPRARPLPSSLWPQLLRQANSGPGSQGQRSLTRIPEHGKIAAGGLGINSRMFHLNAKAGFKFLFTRRAGGGHHGPPQGDRPTASGEAALPLLDHETEA